MNSFDPLNILGEEFICGDDTSTVFVFADYIRCGKKFYSYCAYVIRWIKDGKVNNTTQYNIDQIKHNLESGNWNIKGARRLRNLNELLD